MDKVLPFMVVDACGSPVDHDLSDFFLLPSHPFKFRSWVIAKFQYLSMGRSAKVHKRTVGRTLRLLYDVRV